jgi:hypothetical protein
MSNIQVYLDFEDATWKATKKHEFRGSRLFQNIGYMADAFIYDRKITMNSKKDKSNIQIYVEEYVNQSNCSQLKMANFAHVKIKFWQREHAVFIVYFYSTPLNT